MERLGTDVADYKLLQEIGSGASATVYQAIYLPLNKVVAIKCVDLDRFKLEDIQRETQIMKTIDHPNLVHAYASFIVGQELWIVLPFMSVGSCFHVFKRGYANGIHQESIICSILKETLKGLDYLHRLGYIHRDVKAGNILLDEKGRVKLSDFGISASLFDSGDRQRYRNTFTGTPCWMAPEVVQQSGSGYDSKADIWSFGITALELAHGRPPLSEYPPLKALMMTLQNAPPRLDGDCDKKFSKSFKDMVALCLVKDPKKRPTAEKLLKHCFFKHAKPPEVSGKKLLAHLGPPPLPNPVTLPLPGNHCAAWLGLKNQEEEGTSNGHYQRGISVWNFNIAELKAQAALLPDDDGIDVGSMMKSSPGDNCRNNLRMGQSKRLPPLIC